MITQFFGLKNRFSNNYFLALTGFGFVFASASAVTLFAVFSAFSTSPATAGFELLLRLLPGFFAGWVTGFVADYGYSSYLNRLMFVVVVLMFVLPGPAALFAAGVLTSWSEVSVGALLATHSNVHKSAHIGLAYDLAKFASAGFAAGLFFFFWFEFVVGVVAVLGVVLLSQAYLVRAPHQKVFVWRAATVVPAVLAGMVSLGVGSFLWVQGFYASSLVVLALFAGLFGLAAVLGNLVLVFLLAPSWFTAVAGGVFQVLSVVCLMFGFDFVAMVCLGFGAALFFQSLRALVVRTTATGRDQALFTTSIRLCVALGGILLSLLITHVEQVLLFSAVLPLVGLLFYRRLWTSAV